MDTLGRKLVYFSLSSLAYVTHCFALLSPLRTSHHVLSKWMKLCTAPSSGSQGSRSSEATETFSGFQNLLNHQAALLRCWRVRARCLQPPTRRVVTLPLCRRHKQLISKKKDSFSKQHQPSVNIGANRRPVFFDKSEPKSLNGCFKFPAIFLGLFWFAVVMLPFPSCQGLLSLKKKSGKSEKILGKIWKSWKKMVKVVIRSWYGWNFNKCVRQCYERSQILVLWLICFKCLSRSCKYLKNLKDCKEYMTSI